MTGKRPWLDGTPEEWDAATNAHRDRIRFWRVLRHGGRDSDEWREVVATSNEQMARDKYGSVVVKMRQGGVRLLAPLGTVVDQAWAPRLRTRW